MMKLDAVMGRLRSAWLDDLAQDLAEYALLLFLIALVAVISIQGVGTAQIWNVWDTLAALL